MLTSANEYSIPIEDALRSFGLRSSDDVGLIVFALAEQNLIGREPNDSPQDFQGLFHIDALDPCLAVLDIQRKKRIGGKPRPILAFFLFVGGAAILLAMNAGMIPGDFGWAIGSVCIIAGIMFGPYRAGGK